MIKLKHKDKSYNIPQLWSEVKFWQYKKLKGETNTNLIISVLTGMQIGDVERLSEQSRSMILLAISFVNKPLIADELDCPEKIALNGELFKSKFDIMEETFFQKVEMQNIVTSKDFNIENDCVNIIELYMQGKITGKKYDPDMTKALCEMISEQILLVDSYGIAMDLIKQIKTQLEIESKVLRSSYTSEQMRAGIMNFDQYKHMNIVKALAGGDILKYNDVLMLDYNTVFLHLRMNKTEADFQKAYNLIMAKK